MQNQSKRKLLSTAYLGNLLDCVFYSCPYNGKFYKYPFKILGSGKRGVIVGVKRPAQVKAKASNTTNPDLWPNLSYVQQAIV